MPLSEPLVLCVSLSRGAEFLLVFFGVCGCESLGFDKLNIQEILVISMYDT